MLMGSTPIEGSLYSQPPQYHAREKKSHDPEFDSDFIEILLYRQEGNREKHLLTFTLNREFRDGHYREYEVGGYAW